jgi:hypothetical protein
MRIVSLDGLQQFAAVKLNDDPGVIPGPKIIANAAMVRLNWTLTDGKMAHNVLYCTYTGTPTLTAAVAEAIRAQITAGGGTWTALAAFLAPTTALASVTILDVRTTVAAEFNSTGAAAPGTSAGTALPDEVALAVTLRSLTRGPGGRGRYYVPGWASNAVGAGNVVAAAAVTALQNWAANTVSLAIANAIGLQVIGLPARAAYVSPITGRSFPARASGTLPITQILVRDNHWDTQRRRGLK